MTTEDKYVAAVYLAVFVFVLAWVLIIATKLGRLQREVGELAALVRRRRDGQEQSDPETAEVG